MTYLLVAVGAAAGASLRYVVDRLIRSRVDSVFPWGTLAVNVVGSFVVGVIVSAAAGGRVSENVAVFAGVGFCGALTTYSTFGYETLRLFEGGAGWYGVGNVVVSIVAGLGAAALGWWVG